MGGSDGDRLREIDAVDWPLIPLLYRERVLHLNRRSSRGCYASAVNGRRIPQALWPDVTARAKRVGLRAVACDLGVSHETMRAICKRVRDEAVSTEEGPAILALPHRG